MVELDVSKDQAHNCLAGGTICGSMVKTPRRNQRIEALAIPGSQLGVARAAIVAGTHSYLGNPLTRKSAKRRLPAGWGFCIPNPTKLPRYRWIQAPSCSCKAVGRNWWYLSGVRNSPQCYALHDGGNPPFAAKLLQSVSSVLVSLVLKVSSYPTYLAMIRPSNRPVIDLGSHHLHTEPFEASHTGYLVRIIALESFLDPTNPRAYLRHPSRRCGLIQLMHIRQT